MRFHVSRRLAFLLAGAVIATAPLGARQDRAITAGDYARAEKFLAQNVTNLVVGGSVAASWLAEDRFWYRNQLADGNEFIIVDPAKKTRSRAFDHAKLAAALSTATGSTYDASHLPFDSIDLTPDGRSVSFNVGAKRWACDIDGAR